MRCAGRLELRNRGQRCRPVRLTPRTKVNQERGFAWSTGLELHKTKPLVTIRAMATKVPADKPSWDRLYETAAGQSGHVTTRQAADAGYSPQLLIKHIHAGRIVRVRRGIYRLVHYPAGEHEELVVAWLWFESAGVFSHQTALSLHGLSDAL